MGLINQATSNTMPVEAAPEEVQGLAQVPEAEVTVENDDLNPEEREAYDAAMNMVAEIIYEDDTANKTIMDGMQEGDPPQAIAKLTSLIVSQIEEAFNGEVPETIIVPIGDEVSDLLLELGETKGLFKVDENLLMKTKGAMMQSLFDDYGIEEADMEEMLQGVTSEEVSNMKGMFEGVQ